MPTLPPGIGTLDPSVLRGYQLALVFRPRWQGFAALNPKLQNLNNPEALKPIDIGRIRSTANGSSWRLELTTPKLYSSPLESRRRRFSQLRAICKMCETTSVGVVSYREVSFSVKANYSDYGWGAVLSGFSGERVIGKWRLRLSGRSRLGMQRQTSQTGSASSAAAIQC